MKYHQRTKADRPQICAVFHWKCETALSGGLQVLLGHGFQDLQRYLDFCC